MLAWKAKLIEIGLAIALCYIGYQWIGHQAVSEYKAEQAVAQAEADKAQRARYDKLSEEYETLKAKRVANTNTITRTYEKVIEKPVYSVQCMDAAGVQLANDAIAGRASSQPDAKMPSNQTP